MRSVIGVCSWSLQPSSPAELAERAAATGVEAVQLALDPLCTGRFGLAATVVALADHGLTIRSGMVGTRGEDYSTLDSIARTGGLRPDEHWDKNFSDAHKSAALAAELGLDLVSFHAGFLPEEPGPERTKLIERLRALHRRLRRARRPTRVRDRPGDRADAARGARRDRPRDRRRQLRSGQHDPVRQGRPDRGVGAPGAARVPDPREGRRYARRRLGPGARKSSSGPATSTGARSSASCAPRDSTST